MASLSIHTLGQLQIAVDGKPAVGFDSDKVRALLLYLAVENDRSHRREALAGLLWPEFTESSARANLRRALTNLRKVIGDQQKDPPFLIITRQNIQFDRQSDSWLDQWEFMELIEYKGSADYVADRLDQAVGLYRGPFLEGFSVRDSVSFEEWALVLRQQIDRQVLESLDQLTVIYRDLGDYEQALATAQKRLQLDAWNDAACREVMRLLAYIGRSGEALQVFEIFRQSLIEGIGTEPAVETTALYQSITSGEFKLGVDLPSGRPVRGYEIRERLGSGHYGEVYRAYQPHVGRDVAIKIIQPEFANQPEFIRRFQAEAQLVARLEHPFIVPLYDYWREPDGAFLVMRWLRGGSLKDDLTKGPWNLDATDRLISQIASALTMAHRQGVIHRDIKPANILLDERGDAYLADFGIATMVGPLGEMSGLSEQIARSDTSGSLGYISPEIVLGRQAADSVDIYGLGIVLYELLTGEHPFPGHSGQSLVGKHLHEPIPSVCMFSHEIPSAVDAVVQKATAKDPAVRFTDAISLASTLHEALAPESEVDRVRPEIAVELVNPYKGLRPFQEADASDFFGRQALIDRLMSRILPITDPTAKESDSSEGRLLVVLGPSGSGKSSVVKAGLIPALRKGAIKGSDKWYIVQMVPGLHPLEEMETALLRIAVNPPPSMREQLMQDERGLLRGMKRAVPDEDSQLVLVIDQFEELFSESVSEKERKFFLDSLLTALEDPGSNLVTLLTLRADFYDRPLQYAAFGELVRQHTEVVLPLTPEELQQAIEGPARRMGIESEAGLVAAIVADVGEQPGGLPLMQFVLTELFEQKSDNRLSLASYHEIGGVSGAVGRRADALFEDLDASQKEISRQLFMRLVSLDEGIGVTRRRTPISELHELTSEKKIVAGEEYDLTLKPDYQLMMSVLEAYGRHRLLTFDHEPASRNPTVELAHDALLREWKRLGKWLEESRQDIRLQRLLANAAAEWETAGRDASYLLRGSRLAQYEEWATASTLVLTQLELTFLAESTQAKMNRRAEEEARRQKELETVKQLALAEKNRADEEAQATRRLRRRALLLAGALALAIVLAIAAALFARQSDQNAGLAATREAEAQAEAISAATAEARALDQQALAEAQSRLATGRELAAAALANLEVDPERSILLALEAAEATLKEDGFVIPEAEDALHRSLQSTRVRFSLSPANGANFGPDGAILASGGSDGNIRLWEAESGQLIESIQAHKEEVSRALFSPDGSLLVTTSNDNSAKIWDTKNWEVLTTLDGHTDDVISPAWSPDGKVLITGSLDGTARLWDSGTGQLLHTLVHSGVTGGPDFNADGTLVAVADVDGQVARVWDVVSGEEAMTIDGHSDDVEEVAFSPDGSKLATASADLTAKVWDLVTSEELMSLEGHTGWVFAIQFSPDGRLIATGSEDGTAKLWDAVTGRELLTLAGHTAGIGKIYFSPDGSRLVTNSGDGTARVWDISRSGSRDWLTLDGHTDLVFNVDINQAGSQLATAGWDATAKVWDLESGEELLTLIGHQGEVSRLLFSPSDLKLASASYDGTVKIWDGVTGDQLLNINVSEANPATGEIASVFGLAFHPDGGKLVTTSMDGLIKIWDVDTGNLVLTIEGHEGPVFRPAYSPDGKLLATAGWDSTIRLWDADTGESLLILETPEAINSVAFSSDGSRLAAAGWDAVGRVWDIETGQLLQTLEGHQGIIWDIAYSSDDSTLATGGFDSTVKLWDGESGREVLSLDVSERGAPDLAFSPDDRFLAVGGDAARLFVLPVEDLMDLARTRLTRSLYESECRQYLHLDQCPTDP